MPSILFLTVHRPDRSPSQRFRFEQYIPFLKQNGFRCEHFFLLDEKDDKIFYSRGKIMAKLNLVLKSLGKLRGLLGKAGDYDFIFIQRECFMLGTSYFEKKISRSRAKVIYDFDDSIWLLDVSDANKKFAWLKDPDKTSKIISYCDVVVAGNAYLADYAKQFNANVKVIPTTIDTSSYNRSEKIPHQAVCIGWSGSLTTLKHFDFAVPFLKKLKERFGDKITFKVIGDPTYFNAALNIKGTLWKSETEVEDLSAFDIGIMPLPDDKWAKGKCGLKGLQYMALEIPTVMSPVGVNTEIIEDGVNGFLASTENEWIEKLAMLIESKELRSKIGKAGRETVKERFSMEAQKNNYLSLFKTQ
jgi:glycosyltransferase involved in cell wall biosynthesis